jgi:hypothetical protein
MRIGVEMCLIRMLLILGLIFTEPSKNTLIRKELSGGLLKYEDISIIKA